MTGGAFDRGLMHVEVTVKEPSGRGEASSRSRT